MFEIFLLAKKIKHSYNVTVIWTLPNVVCHVDAKENIYPRKERPENEVGSVSAF